MQLMKLMAAAIFLLNSTCSFAESVPEKVSSATLDISHASDLGLVQNPNYFTHSVSQIVYGENTLYWSEGSGYSSISYGDDFATANAGASSDSLSAAVSYARPNAFSVTTRSIGMYYGTVVLRANESFNFLAPFHVSQRGGVSALLYTTDYHTAPDHYPYWDMEGKGAAAKPINSTYVDGEYSGTLSLNYTNSTGADQTLYFFAEAHAIESVPEPETYAMLLAGLGLLGAIARRRKLA